MYACLAVTCHLHFWQNDRDLLRATVVTRGWNGYRNKSQHRKSTPEKKILPPFQQGFEPATFQSRVRCSNHWAIPAPHAGIKREGLFILWKIRHRRPRIWNKRRILNRKGKAALPCPCMNREACCLQLGQLTDANWNHPLASGFTRERRLLHPATALRHSTNELLTELKTFSSSQLQNLQRPFHQQSD